MSTDSTPISSPEPLAPARTPWAWLLLPFLLGLLVFSSTWGAGFVYDDIELLQTNPAMDEWGTIGRAFAEPFWSLAPFQQNYAGYYRPIPGVAFVVLHKFGGGEPFLYHFASTLVHALCALLVARLALGLGLGLRVGLIAGAAFALAGSHVEAVAWASALPDLLATCFSLLALDQLVRGRLPFAIGALALAMLSKESAYATWLLMVVVAAFGSARLPLPRRAPLLAGLFLVAGLIYVLRGFAFAEGPLPDGSSEGFALAAGFDLQLTRAGLSPSHETMLGLGLVARYLGFLVYPVESRPFRPLRLDHGPEDLSLWGPAALGALALLGAAAIWLLFARRRPWVQIGLGLLFVGLTPVLNTKSIGRFPFEERFVYLSSAGFVLLLALGINRLARGQAKRGRSSAGAGVALILSLAWLGLNLTPIARVTPQWAENEKFARWSTEVSPETMTPWLLAGLATLERAKSLPQRSAERAEVADDAFDLFERSLEVNVNDVLVAAHERESGNVGLGNALYVMGDYDTAKAVFEETLKGFPYAQEAHFGLSNCLLYQADVLYQRNALSSDAQVRAATTEQVLELADRALVHADQAVRGSRRIAAFYHNRSVARYWVGLLRDAGEFPAAEQDARVAFEMDPSSPQYFNHLLELLALQRNLDGLAEVIETYLERNPDAPDRQMLEEQLAALGQRN
ncbi:MAG: hypothetical protein CMJ94_15670 [Planctomycetes bacterium]|nr:hypothetical protein [Planctomycetota bacterium]